MRIYLSLILYLVSSHAMAQETSNQFTKRFETDISVCDPEMGKVQVDVDRYGAVGSAINGFDAGHQHYDLFDDFPDQGYVKTVYEWMPFLCAKTAAGTASGTWLSNDEFNAETVIREENGEVFSEFTTNGVQVNLRYKLNCTVLEYCYTFTNVSDQVLQTVSITPYLDGDLYFGEGGLSNDYGATASGQHRILWTFDESIDPSFSSTNAFISISGLGMADDFLNSYEIGSFSDQRSRIANTDDGCHVLRNDINKREENIDVNHDHITDNGFDVTLALRYDIGPLSPGERSAELCYALQWGKDLCMDDDADEICLINDNCPDVASIDLTDDDQDGIGNICDDSNDLDHVLDVVDNCPFVSNTDQLNTDNDAFGDLCDDDDDGDGYLDVIDNCPLISNENQFNIDRDAFGNACDDNDDNDGHLDSTDNCPLISNEDQLNIDQDTFGDLCDDDDDNDGHLDGTDNCPLISNEDQLNIDQDAFGDLCDDDDDNDGHLDSTDNCPLISNEDQLNTDGVNDGGNACDDDDDDDMILDVLEDLNNDGVVDPNESSPILIDTDADSIPDSIEDADKDGMRDDGETHPNLADTDADGLNDGVEDSNQNGIVDLEETNPLEADHNQEQVDGGTEVKQDMNSLAEKIDQKDQGCDQNPKKNSIHLFWLFVMLMFLMKHLSVSSLKKKV